MDRTAVLVAGWIQAVDNPSDLFPRIYRILQDLPIISISLGKTHIAALTIDGRLFTWGLDYDGVLGLGGVTEPAPPLHIMNVTEPLEIPTFTRSEWEEIICIGVSAGDHHTCALAIRLEVRPGIVLSDHSSRRNNIVMSKVDQRDSTTRPVRATRASRHQVQAGFRLCSV